MIDNTVISDAHSRVIKLLEARGLCLQEEIDFPPFRVDIYLPDYHACIEVDGPHHGTRADNIRDETLLREYSLPTLRIRSGDIDLAALKEFLELTEATFEERWEHCEMRTPWL